MCTVNPKDLTSSKIFKVVSVKLKSFLKTHVCHFITTSSEHSVAGVE